MDGGAQPPLGQGRHREAEVPPEQGRVSEALAACAVWEGFDGEPELPSDAGRRPAPGAGARDPASSSRPFRFRPRTALESLDA